jgi:hypothetical protein
LVNYSKIDAFKLGAQKDTSAEAVKNTGTGYKDKLVILGDVTKPMDFFQIPGRIENEGGSLLHASATYTLIKEPLFEFKLWVQFLLDLAIATIIIGLVAFIRYHNPGNRTWFGKQAIFIYVAVFAILGAGWLLVRVSGVMWLDFMLVAGFLLLHPGVEHRIHKWLEKPNKGGQPPVERKAVQMVQAEKSSKRWSAS